MKPVPPSPTHSQFAHNPETDFGGIHVVTSAYQGENDKLIYSLITCWRLSFWEAVKLVFSRKIYIEQLASTLNPQKLSTSRLEVGLDKVEAMPLTAWNKLNE